MAIGFADFEAWDQEETRERTELRFKVKMTQIQFQALALRINPEQVLSEIPGCRFWGTSRVGKKADLQVVQKWIVNAWNTEALLTHTRQLMRGGSFDSALQWSFAQAYYASFASTLAFFETRGFTESTHTAVVSSFARYAAEDYYPACLSMAIRGSKKGLEYKGVTPRPGVSTVAFDPEDSKTVDQQIAQFLRSTHEFGLKGKRDHMKKQFRTRAGAIKKSLSEADWNAVADSYGWTGLLHLAYRKRIKANYGNIDTFLDPELDAERLQDALISVVRGVLLTHEALIMKAVGPVEFDTMVRKVEGTACADAVRGRLATIKKIVT